MMPTVRIAVKVGIIAASSMAVAIHPILVAGGAEKVAEPEPSLERSF
jgi:hypothetical protein